MKNNPPLGKTPSSEDPPHFPIFGTALALIGAGVLLLIYLDVSIASQSLPAKVPYLFPGTFLSILGIGCLRRRRGAYEAAKVMLTTSITILAGLVTVFALLTVLQIRLAGKIADIPTLGIGIFAILASTIAVVIVAVIQNNNSRTRQATESERTRTQPISYRAIWATAASFALLFDSMAAQNVAVLIDYTWQTAKSEARDLFLASRTEISKAEARSSGVKSSEVSAAASVLVAVRPPGSVQSSADSPNIPSTTGWLLPLGDSGHALWIEGKVGQRWDPATNELKGKLDLPFMPESAVETAQGIVLVAKGQVALVALNGKIYTAGLPVARYKQSVVALADQSVLILGGIVSVAPDGNKVRTNAVERVVFATDGILSSDKLTLERMPDLPGAVRTAFSTVALADGRAMVLGGTEPPYVGCWPCTAETWLLDPKSKTWSAGPKMNEARSDMSATLLPDGSVLVAGGWTPEHGWGGAGSRTVERWDTQKNIFVPMATRMTSYMSMHRALWLPGLEGQQLLLAGGNSAAIQVYDVEHDTWRVAGENCEGTENNRLRTVIPFLKDKQYSVIVQNADWCTDQAEPWGLVPLRLPLDAGDLKSTARTFSCDSGVTLYRSGMTFLPGQNNGLALAVGGAIESGGSKYIITSAADALWPDGHIQSLPGFIHARSGAHLFRLPDGALLLVGGQTNVGSYDHAREKASSAEWLPASSALGQGHWQPFEFWAHDVLGQMADGNLIALSESGDVSRIKISADAQGKPHAEGSELPPLPQPRLKNNQQGIVIRGLPDGRIIVAGGEVQNKRLSIMHEDSMDPNAADEYLRIGESEPTNDYDIYEPSANQWRQSAASPAYGGLNAIYDGGRVVHLYAKAKKEGESGPPLEHGIAISSADGRSWSELKTEELPIVGMKYDTRMFVLQDELFVAGEQLHTNIQTLQWLNGATRRWETLWQSEPGLNWRNDVGRIIIRQLSNGKRVMLPVAGLGGNVSGG